MFFPLYQELGNIFYEEPDTKYFRICGPFGLCHSYSFPGGASGKELTCQAEDVRDGGLISGLGRSPGGGLGSQLQYSCLEKPMDRGAWWATVHRVAQSQTQLK